MESCLPSFSISSSVLPLLHRFYSPVLHTLFLFTFLYTLFVLIMYLHRIWLQFLSDYNLFDLYLIALFIHICKDDDLIIHLINYDLSVWYDYSFEKICISIKTDVTRKNSSKSKRNQIYNRLSFSKANDTFFD